MLGLIIDAMAKDQDLWYCYFNDFIICKLKLGGEDHVPEGDIAQLSMHTFFQQIHSYDALEKVVQLHSHVSVHWLHLAQVAPILRRLNKLQGLGVSCKGDRRKIHNNRRGMNDRSLKLMKCEGIKICTLKIELNIFIFSYI